MSTDKAARAVAPLPPAPEPPKIALPGAACDAHVHLMGGYDEYPLWDGRSEDPAPGLDLDDWLALYRTHLDTIGCTRGLIVHSIFYGTDNSVTFDAVARMGAGFKGVGLLPDDAQAADIKDFAARGMVAVRLNYVHGGVLSWEGAVKMAPILADHGLHIQMLCHADAHIPELVDQIRALPVPLVIDHLGWPKGALTPDSPGFQTLCALMAEGHVYTKLSAPYRMCPAPYGETQALMAALIAANPERCMWGSDWPHVMLNGAGMPKVPGLLSALDPLLTDPGTRRQVFSRTAAELFGWS